jgi:hypothetical protein
MNDKENEEYMCLICRKVSNRKDLGPERQFGIFSCPQCGSMHCGSYDCCGEYQFEPVETL